MSDNDLVEEARLDALLDDQRHRRRRCHRRQQLRLALPRSRTPSVTKVSGASSRNGLHVVSLWRLALFEV
jgi:hypothetical protein